jgi:hypothetical protein
MGQAAEDDPQPVPVRNDGPVREFSACGGGNEEIEKIGLFASPHAQSGSMLALACTAS